MMKYTEMEEFLKENPDVTLLPCAPMIVSGVDAYRNKPDSGFRTLLSNINKKGRGRYKINDHGGG